MRSPIPAKPAKVIGTPIARPSRVISATAGDQRARGLLPSPIPSRIPAAMAITF
jgi:hypothetical protein